MTDWINEVFATVSPNIDEIYAGAIGYSRWEWKLLQQSLVTGSGALSSAIPGLHLVGMAADVAFLMNRMSVCAYGIGAIMGEEHGQGNILEHEDLPILLGKWAGDEGLTDAAIGKAAASAAGKVGGKAVTKILAKAMCEKAGILVGKKLGSKLAVKIGTKFGTKLGTKAAAGFIPFVGAAINGGINLWFIHSIANVAEAWYSTKLNFATA